MRTAKRKRVLPEPPWIVGFANLGRKAGVATPPAFHARTARGLGRYEFNPMRPFTVERVFGPNHPRSLQTIEWVTQGGRRWFRSAAHGVKHPAPLQPALTWEAIASFVRERGLYDPRTIEPADTDPIHDRFLWLDEELRKERLVDCPLADLAQIPAEAAQRILGHLKYLRYDVRHLLLWVLAQHDQADAVRSDEPSYPGCPFPSGRPALNTEFLEGAATAHVALRPLVRVSETGTIRYYGIGQWPQIVYAEMLNVLLDRPWWPRLWICGWCGSFFVRPEGTSRGRPPDFCAVACQKRYSGPGPGEPHF